MLEVMNLHYYRVSSFSIFLISVIGFDFEHLKLVSVKVDFGLVSIVKLVIIEIVYYFASSNHSQLVIDSILTNLMPLQIAIIELVDYFFTYFPYFY